MLQWLYHYREEGITFRSDGNQQLRCFYDSGHYQREVDDEGRQDYKNTYGFVIYWYNGPISWASKRHDHVGLSAPEDEYMALGHAGREVVWLRNLLTEMGLEQYVQEPTIIEGDNLQANRWASSDLITTGNKFIERDYFKVKEWIEAGHLEPRPVPGKENPADCCESALWALGDPGPRLRIFGGGFRPRTSVALGPRRLPRDPEGSRPTYGSG